MAGLWLISFAGGRVVTDLTNTRLLALPVPYLLAKKVFNPKGALFVKIRGY